MKDELKYIIDKEKNIVICIGEDCSRDLISDLRSKSSVFSNYTKHLTDILFFYCEPQLMLNHKYTGVAYCSPFDVFDIEIGKKIARNKMRRKYNASKAKKINKIFDELSDVMDILDDNATYYENKAYDHNEVIQEYRED